jgi:sugar lactone lactonase YvrE
MQAVAIGAAALTLAACQAADPAVDADALPAAESSTIGYSGLTPTTLVSFDAVAKELPESIAVDRAGNIYVSMAPLGEIWKLDPSGAFQEVLASFPTAPGLFGVSGLRFDDRGNLYVANSADNPEARGVWKISPSGTKERIAGTGNIPLPNDLAISYDGTIYITDSATGAVWRALAGAAAEMWVQDQTLEGTGAYGLGMPIGANGIVIAPADVSVGGVVVGNAEKGQVVRIPILPDGRAGQPTVVIADPAALFGLDGMTMDSQGTIYGAVNAGNKVVRIAPDGTGIAEVLAGLPLDFPAGLAFGAGRNLHTLFVVNFSVIHFLHDPPTLDNATPAVIALPIAGPAGSNR